MNEVRNDKVNLSILYVEDELITRMTIHKILAARYATIYLAQDGREGLDIFEQHNPDIIITDTRMPVMDGLKMSKAIRAVNPEVPIIFTTANEDAEFIQETRNLGITRNIIKPILLKDLLATVEEVAGKILSGKAAPSAPE
ncbi:MAG: response regulator [Deltaproteobacteria bacterium]|nr:response regulator [Deltaproteobacteria bacterium]